jgi:hypothetical protein
MAIWQFSVDFIPRKNLINRLGEIPKTIDEEILWKENLEECVDLPNEYENYLNSLGEKEILKWAKGTFNWGDYDNGSHITIDCEDKYKVTIFSRVHVGDWNEEFAKRVLEFAKMCDCVLLIKNENIIEPELDLFIEEMKKSNSYRFCINPVEYLKSDEVKQINWSVRKKLEEMENSEDQTKS